MKPLLKILLGGFLVFMALAIAQEWSFFSQTWFGADEAAAELTPEDREGSVQAVELTLDLMRHLYASGGDSRFADRMPTSAGVLEEMLADIDYLTRNQRRQDPKLERLDVEAVELLETGSVEVRTRELWSIRFLWLDGAGESDPHRVEVVRSRYLVTPGST
ncbi:MAG: hypothetical protein WBI00_16545, partial [Thermoanaerobaculia bacterium]